MAGTLGELEQLLLMALTRRGGEASGIDLREELSERIERTVLPGTVYTILERLRVRGLVTSFTGDATPARGGRRRKYYRLSSEGEIALATSWRQVERMAEGIEERLRQPLEES